MTSQQPIEVNHQGQMIRGTVYHTASSRRGPAVLMLHGFSGQRAESGFMYVDISRGLAKAGITAVTFDFLHSGESDGSFDQMLATGELADALFMTDWLKAQIFTDRTQLGLIGFSLGGLLASCMCSRTDAYSAMVLIAPTTPENLCRHAAEVSGDQPVIYGPHTLHPRLFEDVMTLNPLANITQNPRPTLVVHGTGDKAVSPQVVGQFIDAIAAGGITAETQMIDQAGHSFAHPTWRQQLKDGVVAWLTQQLVK